MHTTEIKVLVEPELKAQVNKARGLVSLSAWVRDAIEMKLKLCPDRDFKYSKTATIPLSELTRLQIASDILGPVLSPPGTEDREKL